MVGRQPVVKCCAARSQISLIRSYVSRCGCTVDNCSRHNNLTIKRPAWTVFAYLFATNAKEWAPNARWGTVPISIALLYGEFGFAAGGASLGLDRDLPSAGPAGH